MQAPYTYHMLYGSWHALLAINKKLIRNSRLFVEYAGPLNVTCIFRKLKKTPLALKKEKLWLFVDRNFMKLVYFTWYDFVDFDWSQIHRFGSYPPHSWSAMAFGSKIILLQIMPLRFIEVSLRFQGATKVKDMKTLWAQVSRIPKYR